MAIIMTRVAALSRKLFCFVSVGIGVKSL